MAEAALNLSNWQSLAAAVAELAVVDLMDHNRRVRLEAGEFIWSNDFTDYLLMADVGHTASACRLSLTRRGILPNPSETDLRKGRVSVKLPEARRLSPLVTSAQKTIAETPAPAPGGSHKSPPDETLKFLLEAPPATLPPSGQDFANHHGVTIIRL